MSDYKRVYIENGTFFFTVVTHHRKPLFTDSHNINQLRSAIRYVRDRRPFKLFAIVVLPDHLHCIWQFEGADVDYSTRWQMIKTQFTRTSGLCKPVWQPRFWEHTIRDTEDLHRHLDYIHYNPVKHGHVESPADWQASSFFRFVRTGWYAPGWGGASDIANIAGMHVE